MDVTGVRDGDALLASRVSFITARAAYRHHARHSFFPSTVFAVKGRDAPCLSLNPQTVAASARRIALRIWLGPTRVSKALSTSKRTLNPGAFASVVVAVDPLVVAELHRSRAVTVNEAVRVSAPKSTSSGSILSS
jgi:hypothetical protein